MAWEQILSGATFVAFPVLRSVAGWAENALKDKKIETFEWLQLGETVVRVGMLQLALLFGAGSWGVDMDAVSAGASAFLIDYLVRFAKKKR